VHAETEPSSGLRGWWARVRPAPGAAGPAASAGVTGAIGGVPDGMAAATLVGVNPIHGLFATAVGRISGGLTASSQLMVVTTTSAAALAAGSALSGVPDGDRLPALFLLTMLSGAAMVVAGILGLGRLTGFVSHSVMIGFLTGVALNIVFDQVPKLAGVDATAPNAIGRALDVVLDPGSVQVGPLLVAAVAAAIVIGLGRTRYAGVAALVALVVTAAGVWVAGATDVALVSDIGDIPRGLPPPALPRLRLLSFDLIAGAAAVAVIVLVQGAGVAESAPNADGARADADADFTAQGIANVAAGLFRGMPVGGSVGQTAVNVRAGARDRWAAIASGAWVLVVLVALSPLVGLVPIPTLATLLVIASVGAIRPRQVAAIWRAGPQSEIALVTTFVATLLLPVAAAVGIGVAISLLLQANRESIDLRVVELVELPDGRFREQAPPARLPDDAVTVLDIHGSLFYAGARSLEAALPEAAGAHAPAVVLRMRGRVTLGATAFAVLAGYARRLAAEDGRLFVSGVDPQLFASFHRVVDVEERRWMDVYEAEPTLGDSTRRALRDAEAWLVRVEPEPTAADDRGRRPAPLTRAWRWVRGRFRRP
jgi:SulP family sulfate permease